MNVSRNFGFLAGFGEDFRFGLPILNSVGETGSGPQGETKIFSCTEVLVKLKPSAMKLAEYLESKSIKRGDFALSIGVSPGWITSLCDGSGWPSREVAEKIASETDGAVTANDFLRVVDVEEARA